jgi:hypothetical protein
MGVLCLVTWCVAWCVCWLFTHIFTGILIFKGLIARRLYKSFGVKGLMERPEVYEAGNLVPEFKPSLLRPWKWQ